MNRIPLRPVDLVDGVILGIDPADDAGFIRLLPQQLQLELMSTAFPWTWDLVRL